MRQLFQNQFTSANPHLFNMYFIDEMKPIAKRLFPPIGNAKIQDALSKTSNFLALEPDHVSWFWLKQILKDESNSII